MELIEFKCNQRRGDTYPALSVNKKGALRFNNAATSAIGIKHGDKVSFYQDKKEPIDWYCKFGEGVQMRDSYDKNGSLIFNFSLVAGKILETVLKDKAMIRIATTPNEEGYYAILTRSV